MERIRNQKSRFTEIEYENCKPHCKWARTEIMCTQRAAQKEQRKIDDVKRQEQHRLCFHPKAKINMYPFWLRVCVSFMPAMHIFSSMYCASVDSIVAFLAERLFALFVLVFVYFRSISFDGVPSIWQHHVFGCANTARQHMCVCAWWLFLR